MWSSSQAKVRGQHATRCRVVTWMAMCTSSAGIKNSSMVSVSIKWLIQEPTQKQRFWRNIQREIPSLTILHSTLSETFLVRFATYTQHFLTRMVSKDPCTRTVFTLPACNPLQLTSQNMGNVYHMRNLEINKKHFTMSGQISSREITIKLTDQKAC